MGSYEMYKHKKEIGEGEKGEETWFCDSIWLIKRESLVSQKLGKLGRVLIFQIAKKAEHRPLKQPKLPI